jgi:selenide,water dikinase
MTPSLPMTKDLVLIGGGHTHALVLRAWGMRPLAGVRLTLINPGPASPYSGMLPGFVAGHYDRAALSIDLVQLARFAGARLILGAATALDPIARQIAVGDRVISFDVASLDVGLTASMPDLSGFETFGVPVKPLGAFAQAWGDARDKSEDIVVLGGGIAGAEIAMAMAHARHRKTKITVIDVGQVLQTVPPWPRQHILRAMRALGINVIENATPVEVTNKGVMLLDGRFIKSDFVTGAAIGRAWPWLAQTGLDLHDGFVSVDKNLQSSVADVFAVGDCAHMRDTPRPKAGVFAVRQAPALLYNLRACLMQRPLRRFVPQRDYLKLVSLGGKTALAEKLGIPLSGAAMWRWKDDIDQRFMKQFADLLPMTLPKPPKERAVGDVPDMPLCAGCGAKVGRGPLHKALQGLPHFRDDVLTLPGDDAAVVRVGGVQQVLTTDHLRAFTHDPALMARIAAVHALGDIWAMGATPQAALAQVVLPRMAPELQARTLTEIMQAAGDVFAQAGAQIVGGHSSQGDEMTLGFSISGLCGDAPITLQGARPGDALILTKPIGTGVVLAAEMQMKASGDVVAGALASMSQPSDLAAHILSKAHAMTDVTGFGLAGHVQGICVQSNVSAQIWLDRIPILPGALGLAKAGVRSSLFADNRGLIGDCPDTTRAELLFDPQTAGGLLAAVDPEQVEQIVKKFQKAKLSYDIIGRITNIKGGMVDVVPNSS